MSNDAEKPAPRRMMGHGVTRGLGTCYHCHEHDEKKSCQSKPFGGMCKPVESPAPPEPLPEGVFTDAFCTCFERGKDECRRHSSLQKQPEALADQLERLVADILDDRPDDDSSGWMGVNRQQLVANFVAENNATIVAALRYYAEGERHAERERHAEDALIAAAVRERASMEAKASGSFSSSRSFGDAMSDALKAAARKAQKETQ